MIQVFGRLILFVLLLTAFASKGTDDPSCILAIGNLDLEKGEKKLEQSDEKFDVYYVGEVSQYSLYRFVSKTGGETFLRRVYISADQAQVDFEFLTALRKVLEAGKDEAKHVRVTKISKLEGNIMDLEAVAATSVQKTFDELGSGKSKQILWDRVWRALNILAASLIDYQRSGHSEEIKTAQNLRPFHGGFEKLPEFGIEARFRNPESGRWEKTTLLFHPLNILVGADEALIIADPN